MQVRLAEVLGALSFGCDLANGYPQGKVLRTAIVAVELGLSAGLPLATVRDGFYTTLLRFLGCTGFAHEEGHIYGAGDDISVRRTMGFVDGGDLIGTLRQVTSGIAPDAPFLDRARAIARLIGDSNVVESHARAQCDASLRLAQIVGVSPSIEAALRDVCERWDGKGQPDHDKAEALAMPTRLFHVADIAELAHTRLGRDGLRKVIAQRSGTQLDPTLSAALMADADRFADRLETPSLWDAFLGAEPEPQAFSEAARVDEIARALGYFVDLKSVYTLGHSQGVAELVQRAAPQLGLNAQETREVVRAAHLHDLGRLSVPNAIWDHPGPLGSLEWERVRLHSYTTERILWQSPELREAARLAGAAHERLDGMGYHRGVPAAIIPKAARLLEAADVIHALGEPRAHRPARGRDDIVKVVADEVAAGKLDREVVDAVLATLDLRLQDVRRAWPGGMSDREVEVLRLIARGKTNKEIGQLLGISARTVQNHVAHVYDKIGVYSRAGAALYVVEQHLID